LHEGFGDGAGEVSLAAGFVFEGVEDGEGGGAEAEGEPDGRGGFLVGELQALFEEGSDLIGFAGLGFETGEQSDGWHEESPFELKNVTRQD